MIKRNIIKISASLLCAVILLIIIYFANFLSYTTKKEEHIPSVTTSAAPTSSTTPQSSEDEGLAILVNSDNPLPTDWETNLVDLGRGQAVDKRAYDDLEKMLNDARSLGYNPLICSSFRTNEKQTNLFENKVKSYKNQGYTDEEAIKEASKWVAYPGTSEHQTGLALDIVSVENQNLNESQLNSEFQLWLMENSSKYGFILRYPQDKTEITNIDFEPWHYRYVGKAIAKEINEKGICLEEYVKTKIQIPDA